VNKNQALTAAACFPPAITNHTLILRQLLGGGHSELTVSFADRPFPTTDLFFQPGFFPSCAGRVTGAAISSPCLAQPVRSPWPGWVKPSISVDSSL